MRNRLFLLLASLFGAIALVLGLQTAPMFARQTAGPGTVIISEVGWSGTAAGVYYEWIELHNISEEIVALTDWELSDNGDINIILSGNLAAHGFYLLERFDDTVSNVEADQVYTVILSDDGETLTLWDGTGTIIDTANIGGGAWPAGTGLPDYLSMERLDPAAGDSSGNWASNDMQTRNGTDINGGSINGTPRQPNSSWVPTTAEIDLSLSKTGPYTATAGSLMNYSLTLSNNSSFSATGVVLSDTLPNGLNYESDNSGLPMTQPLSGMLNWHVGNVPDGMMFTFQLTVTVGEETRGMVTNLASVTGTISETNEDNNRSQAVTTILGQGEPLILIDALFYDGYESGDSDEAVRLINVGDGDADLSGWRLGDGESDIYFPPESVLRSRQGIWIARKADAFVKQFGFIPDYEAKSTRLDVPDMSGSWNGYNNDGDEAILRDEDGFIIDVLIYEDGNTSQPGWTGSSVEPYAITGVFGSVGQIIYRMREQNSGLPFVDTNSATDWSQSTEDIINGRRVRYPGWDLEAFFFSQRITQTAKITVAIAPDNAYELLVKEIKAARSFISVETLSLTSIPIADALSDAARRGVEITVLLEGDPVTGIDDLERHACQRIEAAGGQCWFMISEESEKISDRYRYLHAKFMLIDDKKVIISSENLSPYSLPNDDKDDGTWGRRGVIFVTDAPGVLQRIRAIWHADFDPQNHNDLFRWTAGHSKYGDPPPTSVPITQTGGISYTVRYPVPSTFEGRFAFEVVHSPENSLRTEDGLLKLLNNAGAGDTLLIEQLNERAHWGASTSNSVDDPNPRLESYIAAARRGATVRLLLDDYFGGSSVIHPNSDTCALVNSLAAAEQLDLTCQLANPTGEGIHNKMILANVQGLGYAFIGSINGTELSHKGNREVALLVKSDDIYTLLADMFYKDWPSVNFFPIIYNRYAQPPDHILISEVLYDPSGRDDAEFIELVNPTNHPIIIDGFSLGDALKVTDFEDVRRFPSGTVIQPQETLVVALTASGFRSHFNFDPDLEILDSDPDVANMEDDPAWGDPAAILQLGNNGDEILLRNPSGELVDAIAYGSGSIPGQVSCPGVTASNHSLERYPYWQDTNDCVVDFREWPLPSPGLLP